MEQSAKTIAITAGIITTLFLGAGFAVAQTNPNPNMARTSKYNQQVAQIRQQAEAQAQLAKNRVMEKVRQIRDQRKQEAAERITGQFDQVNQVWTDHFTNVLDKLDDLLARIKAKTNSLGARGEDVAQVTIEISNAEAKLLAARTAINDHAKKIYVIDVTNISGETTTAGQNTLISQLRERFKTMKETLFADLKALRDGPMREARESVQDALQALSQLANADKELAD